MRVHRFESVGRVVLDDVPVLCCVASRVHGCEPGEKETCRATGVVRLNRSGDWISQAVLRWFSRPWKSMLSSREVSSRRATRELREGETRHCPPCSNVQLSWSEREA